MKPTELHNVEPGLLERTPNAGELIAEALKAEGVEWMFGVIGGHTWPFMDPIIKSGIKTVTMRHEQGASYAAQAYARTSGKVGVCYATVGPGTTNALTGIHMAYSDHTPLVLINSGHEVGHDGMGTLQEAYCEKTLGGVTKMVKRVFSNSSYKFWVRRAFEEAMAVPRGPTCVEFELENILGKPAGSFLYNENWVKEPIKPAMADQADVAKIARWVMEAERPAMLVGDSMMWSRATAELKEFADLAQIPVMGRRGARGMLPEDDPLCFKSFGLISESDCFLLWGAKLNMFEQWGGGWKPTKLVQVGEPVYLNNWMDTDLAVGADPGAVLKQVIAYIKEKGLEPPKSRAAWIKTVQDTEKKRRDKLMANAERFKDRAPIHGNYLAKVTYETLTDLYNNDVLYGGDSYTGWNLMSPYMVSKNAGGVFDAGPLAGIGHSVAQAIGATLGLDRKKIALCMVGDAGIGLSGFEIETAVRHKIPVVYMVYNNDMWLADNEKFYGTDMKYYGEQEYPVNFLGKDIRYDKMFECCGAHGEWVTLPTEIRPALERACKAAEKGQPAVLNVDVSNEPLHSLMDTAMVAMMESHLPWNEIPNLHKKLRRKYLYDMFKEGFDKYGVEDEPYDRFERVPGDCDVEG